MSPHPLKNKEAPSITLRNQDDQEMRIQPGSMGTPLAIFFYPAAHTYGCTKEACGFRDAMKEVDVFKRSNVAVFGISGDAVAKQKSFVDQYGLPYPVLSDSNGEARKAYQIKKSLLGLAEGRVTFVIDSKGVVRDVFSSALNFTEHVSFVRKSLEAIEAEAKETQGSEARTSGEAPSPAA